MGKVDLNFSDMVEAAKEFSGVTMQELDGRIRELREVRNKIDEIDSVEIKPLKKKLAFLENWVAGCLKEHNKKTYKSCYGDVTLKFSCSMQIPKETHDKEAFREYLIERELFDSMWSIHSGSLNKWYNDYVAACEVKGKTPDKIPGLGEPVDRYTLAFKSK